MRKPTYLFCLFFILLMSFTSVYGGRYYMPQIARWTTPDPALQRLSQQELLSIHNGMLLSTSPYSYTFNNPLKYTDPNGRIPVPVAGAIGGALFDVGIQVFVEGKPITAIDLESVAISAGAGAVGVGLATKFNKLRQFFRLGSKAEEVVNVSDDLAKGIGDFAVDAAREGGKSFTKGQLKQFQRQLVKEGKRSLEKSRAKLQKRLDQHIKKLEDIKKNKGQTSSVEREIRNFQQQINAIDEVLKGAQ